MPPRRTKRSSAIIRSLIGGGGALYSRAFQILLGLATRRRTTKMPRAPNYNQARGDRNRAKEQKKQERLRRREEDALHRKATRSESTVGADPEDPPAPTSSPTVTE
jgi:hypothetical protein